MILLLCGPDHYRRSKRLNDLKLEFDSLNIDTFIDNFEIKALKNASDNLSFFSSNKLIIINGASKIKDKKLVEEINNWLTITPETNTVVFVEEESLTPSNWLTKAVKISGKIEDYQPLKPYEVTRWIKDKTKEKGGDIDPVSAELLTQMIGNDLFRINNELDKLIAYNKNITKQSINELVEPEFLDSIFSLMDAISEKKEKKAIALLNNFLKEEGNEIYLITMLARQIRNLIMVKEAILEGKKESEIAIILKLHPFVIKNTTRQCENFTIPQLIEYHTLLLEVDFEIKSSNLDPKILLVRLIHQFVRN